MRKSIPCAPARSGARIHPDESQGKPSGFYPSVRGVVSQGCLPASNPPYLGVEGTLDDKRFMNSIGNICSRGRAERDAGEADLRLAADEQIPIGEAGRGAFKWALLRDHAGKQSLFVVSTKLTF